MKRGKSQFIFQINILKNLIKFLCVNNSYAFKNFIVNFIVTSIPSGQKLKKINSIKNNLKFDQTLTIASK